MLMLAPAKKGAETSAIKPMGLGIRRNILPPPAATEGWSVVAKFDGNALQIRRLARLIAMRLRCAN
jgi:hypothetical protein